MLIPVQHVLFRHGIMVFQRRTFVSSIAQFYFSIAQDSHGTVTPLIKLNHSGEIPASGPLYLGSWCGAVSVAVQCYYSFKIAIPWPVKLVFST
jgi:hypothetical protein